MSNREKLHSELIKICPNAYFQPPENLSLVFPCIVYSRGVDSIEHADNRIYKATNRYDLTIIEKHPNSTISDDVRNAFPYCEITNRYITDNLYHTKIKLYY